MSKLYTKNTWQDELLADIEKYQLLDDSGSTIYSAAQLLLATSVINAGTPVTSARMNNIENGIDAIDTRVDTLDTSVTDISSKVTNLLAGWIELPNGTRVSDTSFTLPGDFTNLLKNCAKWKGQLNSAQKYGYALSSTYASGFTTVTLAGNNDYKLDSSGAISGMYVSFANPPDFPTKFSYTPTVDASGSMTVTVTSSNAYFQVSGGWLNIDIALIVTLAGTASNQVQIYYPFSVFGLGYGTFSAMQNQTATIGIGAVYRPSATYFGVRRPDGTNYSLGSGMRFSANGMVSIA